jgi:hypothetical protein
MSANSAPRELAKSSEDDGTIPLPPPGSQTSHGELQRLDAACDTARRRAAELGSDHGDGPAGELAEDAAVGLGRRRIPRGYPLARLRLRPPSHVEFLSI